MFDRDKSNQANNFHCKPRFNEISVKMTIDEISIKRSLEYNKQTDIEGFEDSGRIWEEIFSY